MPDPDLRDDLNEQTRVPWWLWPHVLSLEAPLIAVIWQTMLARAHHIALMPSTTGGLALTVWLIYVADRLLDGMGGEKNATDLRHAFYRRHRALFVFGVLPTAGVLLAWIALFRIPEGLLFECVALALLIGIYLASFPARHHHRIVGTLGALGGLLVIIGILSLPLGAAPKIQFSIIGLLLMTFGFFHRLDSSALNRIPKEPLGSLLFALGCSAGVQFYSMSDGIAAVSIDVVLLWALFGLNMLGISHAEKQAGARDAASVSVIWPRLSRAYPALLLVAMAACAWIVLQPAAFPSRTAQLAGSVAVSLTLLALVFALRSRLSPLSHRVLADLALAAPALVLLLPDHG